MIEVVDGLIVRDFGRDRRVLLTQRRVDQDLPLYWQSPGGKVEVGESHHDALRRELREEIGVEMSDIKQQPTWQGEFRRDGLELFVSLYSVQIVGDPKPLEGQGMGWFLDSELANLRHTPSNTLATAKILAALSRR